MAVEAAAAEVLRLLARGVVRVLDREAGVRREIRHRESTRRRRAVEARLGRDHHRAILELDTAVVELCVSAVRRRHVVVVPVRLAVQCRRVGGEHARRAVHRHRLTIDDVAAVPVRSHHVLMLVSRRGRVRVVHRLVVVPDVGERRAADHAVLRRAQGRE